jgi:hypothetical protein
MRALIVILLLAATIAAAQAFGLGLGNRFGRLGASGQAGAVSPPPAGCSGVIDASAGCPLPMLGI